MPVTDLHSAVPNPPAPEGDAPLISIHLDGRSVEVPLERPLEAATARTFGLELPDDAPATPPAPETPDAAPEAPCAAAPGRRPLPSYAVIAIGGLALTCLALAVALVAALSRAPEPADARSAPIVTEVAPPAEGPAEGLADAAPSPAAFPAEPAPIPVDLITRLEAASDQPLDVELGRLLEAIQHGFGTRSARLEPTLRSYVYRMSARFEWNPNTFRVAVTAPDARLAEARKALLDQLFADAVASGRLEVGVGTGPHALSLVTE